MYMLHKHKVVNNFLGRIRAYAIIFLNDVHKFRILILMFTNSLAKVSDYNSFRTNPKLSESFRNLYLNQ